MTSSPSPAADGAGAPLFRDPAVPLPVRVSDLLGRLTVDEKIAQLVYDAPGIDRLGIPPYNWWNECLHGVGRAGLATVFPQAIGLAATWNVDLLAEVATAISDEARAKHHAALREGRPGEQYFGLTFWSPNINIFRDPRWGRGQETYGEDPYLTARMGVTFVRGLQGDDPRYLKLVATPKHFAVHSGPEADRHHFDVDVSERDLRETYLPAFRATVQEGGAVSVMSAYQRFRGEPCSASPLLLQDILRDAWSFDGYVVSDCWAINDIYLHHQVVATAAEAAALAIKAGCDLNCGEAYAALTEAVAQGLVDEADLDRALGRLFTARFRLGMFDPPEQVPYAQLPVEVVASPAHRALARRAARESIVLLKNDGLLPLAAESLRAVAVIGPNADDPLVLLGNYHGTPAESITPLAGLRRALPAAEVLYAPGCSIAGDSTAGFDAALAAADEADVVIAVLGLSQVMEGEEGQEEGVAAGQRSAGDRATLDLPGAQEELLKTLHATGTPLVVVLLNGSALAVNWADQHANAILEAWYPGEAGGAALADVLLGAYNPGGRLPVTFYRSVEQLPPFDDYDMAGRTYRYFTGEPLYPFGYGLSYTAFSYHALLVTPTPDGGLEVSAQVMNAGPLAGDEVVQVYARDSHAAAPASRHELRAFTRVRLLPGEVAAVTFTLAETGQDMIWVGGGQPASGAPGIRWQP